MKPAKSRSSRNQIERRGGGRIAWGLNACCRARLLAVAREIEGEANEAQVMSEIAVLSEERLRSKWRAIDLREQARIVRRMARGRA